MVLLLDNYDSFVHNLARYLRELGRTTVVVRSDAIGVEEIERLEPEALVISPGPCAPEQAGVSVDAVRALHRRLPILGVCLGHQAIGAAFGGRVVRGPPCHGRTSLVTHDGRGIFRGLASPIRVARYHSLRLAAESIPPELEVSAHTEDGTVMAVRHRSLPVVGVQFHPESVLTEHGHRLLASFLALADARRDPASGPLPAPHPAAGEA